MLTTPKEVAIVIVSLIILPIEFGKCLWHCFQFDHNYDLTFVNFYIELKCHNCEKIFTKTN